MSENKLKKQIQLLEIQTINFNAELFLQYLLYRGQLALNLSQQLDSAISNRLIDDNNNQYNLSILKICVVQCNYYFLLQGTNFLSEYQYAGMANQLKKIFKDENEYQNEIATFSKVQTNTSKKLRQDIFNLFEQCQKQKNAIPIEFSKIVNYITQTKQGDLKFEKLQQQLNAENQINYDIYSYFFKLYYQQEWFTSNYELQTIKLLCYIEQFIKFDIIYPIQYYADQMLIFQKIQDNQPIEYYKTLMEQF